MKIKKFEKDIDIESQRLLFKECFPENNGTSVEMLEHYMWKFHSFPNNLTSYEFGAYLKNDLVGYYAAIPYEYKIKNLTIKVGMVCDVMTGVKARGKGVFTKMGVFSTSEMQKEGLEFTLGYPIREEVIPGHIKAGWEKLFPLPLYMNFLSSKSLLKNKKISFIYPLIDLFLIAYNRIIGKFQKSEKYDIKLYSSSELDEIIGFNQFIDNWVTEQGLGLNKNINFLKWRLGAPEKKYKIIIAKFKEEIVGYAVFTETVRENVPCIAILDISCLKNHKKLASSIIYQIQKVAKSNGKEIIMIMASKYFSKTYSLISNGFFRSPFKFWLIIKNLGDKYKFSFLKDEKNWHLTWIDSDNF